MQRRLASGLKEWTKMTWSIEQRFRCSNINSSCFRPNQIARNHKSSNSNKLHWKSLNSSSNYYNKKCTANCWNRRTVVWKYADPWPKISVNRAARNGVSTRSSKKKRSTLLMLSCKVCRESSQNKARSTRCKCQPYWSSISSRKPSLLQIVYSFKSRSSAKNSNNKVRFSPSQTKCSSYSIRSANSNKHTPCTHLKPTRRSSS